MTMTLFDLGETTPTPVVKPFQTIVADCPWQPRDALPGPGRGAKKHYKTMSTSDLCSLHFRFPHIAPDALLFNWRLSSMPSDGLDVCRAWGFEPVSEIVWVKVPRFRGVALLVETLSREWSTKARARPSVKRTIEEATALAEARIASLLTFSVRRAFEDARRVRMMLGHYVRLSHEVCIIAARPGSASRILAHNIPSVFFAPLGKHSEKPDDFYDIVERLTPGPYLELFARRPRGPNWAAIGDQLGTTLDLPLAPTT